MVFYREIFALSYIFWKLKIVSFVFQNLPVQKNYFEILFYSYHNLETDKVICKNLHGIL